MPTTDTLLSETTLRRIAARASTLTERIGSEVEPDEDAAPDVAREAVARRLTRWRETAGDSDDAQFDKRLAWDGLDRETVRAILGPVRMADDAPLPPWAHCFQDLLHEAAELAPGMLLLTPAHYAFLKADHPIPFEELLTPFVLAARRRAAATSRDDLLTDEARAALERALLKALSRLFAPTLDLEFTVFRTRAHPLYLFDLQPAAAARPERVQYQAFIAGLGQGGWAAFFEEYTVLARLLATRVRLWVEATTAFLDHLAADLPAIQATFHPDADPGPVTALKAGLSDPHRGNRSVFILTFASGLKLVYKPRPLGIEAAYEALVQWLNAHAVPWPLRPVSVLDRRTHGWVECIEPAPCTSEAEVERYYRRAGLLLALVYLLEGSDFHAENLIACGEQPVLVDLETLLHHRPRPLEGQPNTADPDRERFNDSVVRTLFLPWWRTWDGRKDYDISGLGCVAGQDTAFKRPRWDHVNTDRMTVALTPAQITAKDNLPTLAGKPRLLRDYGEALVDGFEAMGRYLITRREALLAADGPWRPLADQTIRFLFRNTRTYALVLRNALHPRYARTGADWQIELDILSRGLLTSPEKNHFWPMLRAEQAALTQLDIPFFATRAGSQALLLGDGTTLTDCFEGSAYDRAVAHLQTLDEADLRRQAALIREILQPRETNPA